MFGKALARQVLSPSAAGNPVWVADPVHWAVHLTLGRLTLDPQRDYQPLAAGP